MLMLCAMFGKYEMCQMLLQFGADVTMKDNWSYSTALKLANFNGYATMSESLMLSSLGASMSSEVLNRCKLLDNQINGIISVLLNNLTDNTLKEINNILIKCMDQILPFSDDLLLLCFCSDRQLKKNFSDNDLFKTIIKTFKNIISNKSKISWAWLNNYLLKSNIWIFDNLFSEILKYTQMESDKISKKYLKEVVNKINKNDWNELISFNIKNNINEPRQKIKIEYNKNELLLIPNNMLAHYNINIYLNRLILYANIIDNKFQQNIQLIISDINIQNIIYRRGPTKKVERSKIKVEHDYGFKKFPAASHLIDINRCMLTFETIKEMLLFLNKFIEYIEYIKKNKKT